MIYQDDAIERSKEAAWDQYEAQLPGAPKPVVNHNLKNYGEFVEGSIKDCADSEKRWLCNRISKIHAKGFSYRKNHRLCKANSQGGHNMRYSAKKKNGRNTAFDVKLVNVQTGNIFWYGFNYGR